MIVMCGRYPFQPEANFLEAYEIENTDFELHANYNTAPGQIMPVITMNSPKQLHAMKWGLIPFWAKDDSFAYKTINARSEEVDQKASCRGPIKSKRCLIPTSGFYEWEKKGKEKWPFLFTVKDRPNFCFAGLYDVWKNPNGQEVYSYTILTTRANKLVSRVHDRMPVILSREDEEVWADNSEYDPKKLAGLMQPYPAELMDSYPVSKSVNSPANNSKELLVREPLNSK